LRRYLHNQVILLTGFVDRRYLPLAVGVIESIIVVSDLFRKRPIWFGGTDRSEASMAAFYDWLGPKKISKIGLAVMDMWKPFRNITKDKAPQAAILFDKFHVMRVP
jgi:transposase